MHVGDRLMKQKGWKIIGAHSLPAAKAVNTVTTFRDVARGGLNAENSFGFQSKGEICLLTFLFIEQLSVFTAKVFVQL
jgi:hypothetical protein